MSNQTISDQQLEARQGRKIDYYDYLNVHLRDSKDANFTKEFSLLLTRSQARISDGSGITQCFTRLPFTTWQQQTFSFTKECSLCYWQPEVVTVLG